jgi:hypothetical protein
MATAMAMAMAMAEVHRTEKHRNTENTENTETQKHRDFTVMKQKTIFEIKKLPE